MFYMRPLACFGNYLFLQLEMICVVWIIVLAIDGDVRRGQFLLEPPVVGSVHHALDICYLPFVSSLVIIEFRKVID
ncbi:hypothetical protein RchiOBHm_Chr3g0475201 [Rosa chinensis]|uniref:Uncharacterized protein n=1 Tax=Rosa chinensis TaxID=74649 RepID=A0A2P6RCC8_ROSCH|nr:hypothetical protein RchiOBHm_Chr3g0475201 [Rosa chinensis]